MSELNTDNESDKEYELSAAEDFAADSYDNSNYSHTINGDTDAEDKMPTPMIIKQEPDMELPIETENEEFQNHFQIISVKSLHPLEQLMGIAEENETSNQSSENADADNTEDCSIKEMLQTTSTSKGSFGIANYVEPEPDHESDDNSLLVEAKRVGPQKIGRPLSDNPKRRKSKLDIFRRRQSQYTRTKTTPSADTEDDDTRMSGMTADENEHSNEGESQSLVSDTPFSFAPEIEQVPSTSSSFQERSTRRKSVHKPYDIAMEIVDDASVKKDRINHVRNIKNPHMDYIKKVAFLRVCINHILKELGHPQFNFSRNLTFKYMRDAYNNCYKN